MDKQAREMIKDLESKLRESAVNASLRLLAIEPGLCERGETLLVNENEDGSGGDFVAYFRQQFGITPLGLNVDEWLLVSWHPGNYPALHVSILFKPEDELAKFIQNEFEGWKVRKCNIAGVVVDAADRIA